MFSNEPLGHRVDVVGDHQQPRPSTTGHHALSRASQERDESFDP